MRHTDHYTVVGNHLAQHRALSLVAIGLALHIQSLPTGARVGIKVLTDRFPEGEVRIASALRELEAYGYLERSRVRTESGKLLTRTVSYNRPRGPVPPPEEPPPPPVDRAPVPEPEPAPVPVPEPAPVPVAPPAPVAAPAPPPEAAAAVDLLARLREDDPRLLLAERDVRQLAPGVAAWLERGAEPQAVRHVLTGDLPADLRRPAALIGYRLREGIPPRMPAPAPAPQARRPDPMQNCDGCDRAFRAPAPGRCRECPPESPLAA
ncbi:helix-turn-helix domain-containing protein [Streptomyces sp. NBC_00091]|uniref:helix-turn-helix domain-containing protein n=1 Tax=Streptomyces sp. NBC_00091 TaxID=2975648 RepID=UPI0022592BDC|nr:helix-turn-helix domain-containing protein [Streptomyces sp. NBC_00091]MCX5377794.1 helix-turn-helix domain-containing protein [Streptomyces sp. NBC_00091]